MKKNRIIAAVKESITDTIIAFAINVPLNFLLIAYAFEVGMNAFETSILLTVVMTVLAIIRKTMVRLSFARKNPDPPV